MDEPATIKEVLTWITGILNRLEIPYQVTGGLAARCYGSTRPLNDIDFYVPGQALQRLEDALKEYITLGPIHYKDDHWDLVFMKLNYKGQQIEFGDADQTKYFDAQSGTWVTTDIQFDVSTPISYQDVELCVMPKKMLVEYKRRLDRDVDRVDLRQIQGP